MMAASRKPIFQLIPAAAAAALYLPLFAFEKAGFLDFWLWMAANAVAVTVLAFWADRSFAGRVLEDMRKSRTMKILLGILAAAVLYFVFYLGNLISRQLFSFAGNGISRVYELKKGASTLRVGLLIGFLIGPAEEIFWRGYLQHAWQAAFGGAGGWLLTSAAYSLIHVTGGNPMLVLAAAVCGLFWGALYWRCRSLLLVAVSHALWDLAVFIFWPFAGQDGRSRWPGLSFIGIMHLRAFGKARMAGGRVSRGPSRDILENEVQTPALMLGTAAHVPFSGDGSDIRPAVVFSARRSGKSVRWIKNSPGNTSFTRTRSIGKAGPTRWPFSIS